MLLDLHVHSSHTPGVSLSIADLAVRVKAVGLDGFCLTDIHTVAGVDEATAVAARVGLTILVGFEAHTDRGHYLVFVPDPKSLPVISTWLRQDPGGRIAYVSLRQAVEERDGILIAAHPYDRNIPGSPGDGLVQQGGVSAVEVQNGRRPPLINDLAEEVAAGVGLPGVGGSDARGSLEEIGRVGTLVRGEVKNEADLIDRIRSLDVWPVTMGTLSERDMLSGEPEPRHPRSDHGPRSGAHGGRPERARYGRDGERSRRSGEGQGRRSDRPAGPRPPRREGDSGSENQQRRPRRRGPKPEPTGQG